MHVTILFGDREKKSAPDQIAARARAVVDRALTRIGGQVPVRGAVKLDAPLITKQNAKEYYFPDSPF